MRRRLRGMMLASVAWLAACGGSAPAKNPGDEARAPDAMPGMASMEGMTGGGDPPATGFRDAMRQHLDSLVRLEPNRLVFVRAGHDSLARGALERMDREMATMNMAASGLWQALADSVRRDLSALNALAGEAFVLRMRAHAGRLRRLIDMHQRMMGRMPM